MDLPKHGFCEIKQYDDIVKVKFIGSMNLECYIEYSNKILAIAKGYNGSKWAEIHDYREWELVPPEVFERSKLDESNPEKQRFRCTDHIIIISSALKRSMLLNFTDDDVYIKPSFAMNDSEALSILQSKGYKGKIS